VIGGTAAAVRRRGVAAPDGVPLVWHDPWPGVSAGGWAYAAAEPHPGAGRDWAEGLVAPDELDRIIADAASGSVSLAGTVAADALRIAAWRPRWSDVDERTLPHELDWMRTAVHLDKGCYRGQETVAKVHNLGHPPRRVVALQLDGVVPAPGDAVRDASVRRSTPVGSALTVDTADGPVAAAQEVIVPPEAGATAAVPRIPRLGRRAQASGSPTS